MSDYRKQPGGIFDKKGFPIYPGDLIRTPHFVGARRKQHYLYHTAVYQKGYMEMVATCHLDPNHSPGGRCALTEERAKECEIISGHGPVGILVYSDRPKIIRINNNEEEKNK